MSLISDLFGRSPIGPIQGHMKVAVACAREVVPFVEAMAAGDREAMIRHRAAIEDLEHQADSLKHEIRRHLPRRLMMAIERRDMLDILDAQDSIADRAQDVAELADLRGMTLPDALREPVLALIRRVVAACEQGERVVNELDELVEAGFGGRESERLEGMIAKLNQLESETDDLLEKSLLALFSIEDELGIGTFFWYRLVHWMAEMADQAEKVGNRLRLLIAS